MSRIFISYRRADAPGDAGRLADHLYRRFGSARVFLDIDTILPGTDFVQVLQSSLQQTAAVLVVIGPLWTTVRDAQGTRRLDDANDFVRLEVEAALARGIPVVPVLVQGATMPRTDQLPAPLSALATRQSFAIDHHDFHADAERLCDRLAAMMGDDRHRRSLLQRWWPAAVVLVVLAMGLVGYQTLRERGARGADGGRGEEDTRVLPRSGEADRRGGRTTRPPRLAEATPPVSRETAATPLATRDTAAAPQVTREATGVPPVTGAASGTPSVRAAAPREEPERGRAAARPARTPNAGVRGAASNPAEAAAPPGRAGSTPPPPTPNRSADAAPGATATPPAATSSTAGAAAPDLPAVSGAATREQAERADALVAEAAVLRRRQQYTDALATLARAREVAPASAAVQRAQEDVAMEWIRNVRLQGEKSTFGAAIKPGTAVIDAALATATGTRRADLLAHSGWATFLLWRDGNRQLDPTEWYRDALAIDPVNPYANAMFGHWLLFQGDDVPRAAGFFATAHESKRASDVVRMFQWSAYDNTGSLTAEPHRIQLADAMRRDGTRLTMGQAQILWRQFNSLSPTREPQRLLMLDALPPDEYLATLSWAFTEYAANDASRERILRYYRALLHDKAGRTDQARRELTAMAQELEKTPGALQEAVRSALSRIQKR